MTPNMQLVTKGKLVRSAFVFAMCYVFLIACTFLMIIVNDPSGWKTYFEHDYSNFFSMCVCILFLFAIIYCYYYFEDKTFLAKAQNTLLIFSVIIVTIIICYLTGRFLSIYARPVALLALLFLFFLNRRQAIMMNFIFSLMMFVIDTYTNNFMTVGATNEAYCSLMLGFVCGTFAVFIAGRAKTRGGLLFTGLFLSIPTIVVVILFELTASNISAWRPYVSAAGYGILGCVFSASFALALMPLFEIVFNKLTAFRLRELTSANAPLLRRLREEAPGTFNHSLIVAQLAESCAIAIGENAELARAAAYYHDVGKLKQPDCFTENQSDYNLHDELTPELSADIIRSHTRDGYELLKKAHLPSEIADIACEHHGTLPIKYFYDKAMRLSGGDANIRDYSYLGPKPKTKVAAILMIVDAAEAAARSVRDRSPENVDRIVRSIIEERMDLDQFTDCAITMRDLSVIRQTLVEALSGVHHHRVKYPSIKFNRARQAVREEDDGNK